MVKSKNIIAGLGVVAGLGMALLPLGAFATDGQIGNVESNNVEHVVRGVVGDIISISVSTNSEATLNDTNSTKISKVDLTPGKLNSSLVHTVTVNTNARGGYNLYMNAKTAKDVDLRYITSYDPAADTASGKLGVAKTFNDNIKIATVGSTDVALANLAADSTAEGQWGYKVKESGAATYTGDYKAIPAPDATYIARKTSADVASEDDAYENIWNVNFGIVPANDQLSGAYEATLVYKAITNAI